jgi:hypothetical protein
VAELQHARDPNRLQAIVLLTDGQENNSRASLEGTLRATADIELVFGIAFGADANIETLRQLARAPERAMRASVDDIDKIYDLLSMKM